MRVFGLIPARSGSKGVPGKNVRLLHGKPLLQYTADCALKSAKLSRVVLSTEDPAIAELGRRLGVDVPFLRPSNLAQDDTPMLPVMQHAIQFLDMLGDSYDAVCLLQPTNPFRKAETIDACVALLEQQDCDSVVTVLPVPCEYNPHWVYFTDRTGFLRLSTGEAEPISRRQQLPQAFHREGSVYVVKTSTVMRKHSLYGTRVKGYLVDAAETVNIDGPEDWKRAEEMLAGGA